MSSAADVGISNMMSGNNVIPQGAPVPQGYTAVGSHPNGTIVAPTSVAGDVPADPSFLASVNWNVVLPAGVAALQAYNAYNAYKKGDKVGATLQGAGALASGAAAASAAGIGGATTATIGAAAAPIAGIAGAYQGYQTAKYTSDAPAGGQRDRNTTLGMASAGAGIGATIGSIVPGAGTAAGAVVGAAVGALAGLASSKFGSSKGKQQMLRDAARKSLQSAGLLDQNYQGTLADGSSYDFGKDGKKYGKLNTENPNWGLAAGFANVIGAGEGLYGRSLESVATMYANAAMSNSGGNQDIVLANMRHFAQQRGFNLENVSAQINKMFDDNLINENQKAAYLNGAQQIFGAQQPDQTAIVPRPRKGEVARVSAGLYRNDRGQLVPGKTMKEALQRAYESPSKSKRK
jgi:hypothetical protein